MAALTVNLEDMYRQFKIRAELEAKVAELQAKLDQVDLKKNKKKDPKDPKDPNEPEKPKSSKAKLTPEELAQKRKENGQRLAAANKARREAQKAASVSSKDPESDSDHPSQQETPVASDAEN